MPLKKPLTDAGGETDAARSLQLKFHRSADVGRFVTRRTNPFIRDKETKLFQSLGAVGGLTLEIGCGEGNNKTYLAALNPGITYVGIDFSLEKVAFASGADPDGVYLQADAIHLPFKAGCFDSIIIRDVLHHADAHRDAILAEALRILKKDGKMRVIEGNVKKALNMAFCILVPAERGMINSTPVKFRALCEKHGCEAIEFRESFFLVRAINYFLGWSENPLLKPALGIIYSAALGLENFFSRFLPEDHQAYMIAYFTGRAKASAD